MSKFEQHLGLRARLPHGSHRLIVQDARQREDGVTVIPIGSEQGGQYDAVGHLYLTVQEREELIVALMKHRKAAPGADVSSQFDAEELELLASASGDLARTGDASVSMLDRRQVELVERARRYTDGYRD